MEETLIVPASTPVLNGQPHNKPQPLIFKLLEKLLVQLVLLLKTWEVKKILFRILLYVIPFNEFDVYKNVLLKKSEETKLFTLNAIKFLEKLIPEDPLPSVELKTLSVILMFVGKLSNGVYPSVKCMLLLLHLLIV